MLPVGLAGKMTGAWIARGKAWATGGNRQAAEAMAFSLMGRNTLLGLPNHLPRCTGASHAAVLGEITLGTNPRLFR